MLTASRPAPLPPEPDVPLPPDPLGYRLKNRLLGPPLHTEQLEHERLGKPTALAVFASDNLSSSAYATEEILRVLVPAVGVAAFSLVMPITFAMLAVLALLILSYRQTIKAYPKASGAYIVVKDNYGILPAQVAGVSLLIGYVLTVSVSVAAGTAALASAFHALIPWRVPISLFFIALVTYGNLRGTKESGKVFAVPTYFFIGNMGLLLAMGLWRWLGGDLPVVTPGEEGMLEFGEAGDGLLLGASFFIVLRAFASGGAAVTGVEAISDGVPAFRKPEWKNARTTLLIMGATLGVMFFGLSSLASRLHVVPFEEGSPTVLAQIGEAVYGDGTLGRVGFYALQAATMLILVIAANTSYADFPRLASFAATDHFLPRQLTKRGHRLVFSNGMLALAATSAFLVVVTNAEVERLIPLYAIGVFFSFTLSQSAMAKHHVRHKRPGWRWGLALNGIGATISITVVLIIAVTKFTEGAWVVIVLVPVLVMGLVRLNRQYRAEAEQLEADVPAAVRQPLLRRHVVLVLIDKLDLAAARAIQYGRSLRPDELRAVHFVLDKERADALADTWRQHGLSAIPLELVDCPDRRLTRAAVATTARALGTGDTEVSVLVPDRQYKGAWRRILHDQTAVALARDVSQLPHANVTTVPFPVDPSRPAARVRLPRPGGDGNGHRPRRGVETAAPPAADGVTPISEVKWRQRVTVAGRVQAVRVQPLAGTPSVECTLVDATGGINVVFLGRREVAGIAVGVGLRVSGMVIDHHGRLAVVNPVYELLPG